MNSVMNDLVYRQPIDKDRLVYEISGPRYWRVSEGAFIEEDELPDDAHRVYLQNADGQSTVAVLYDTLKEYGYPLGELAAEEDKLNKLVEDNKDYLMRLMMLSILGLDVPDEDMEHYVKLRSQAGKFSGMDLVQFLKG